MSEVEARDASRALRDYFPATYREMFDAATAVIDIGPLQAALSGAPFGVRLHRPAGQKPHRFDLRLFHPAEPIALSDILPPLECLGLRVLSETPFVLGRAEPRVALQVLSVETVDRVGRRSRARRRPLRRSPGQGVGGRAGKRRLQPPGAARRAGWREVAVLRAYARYLRQAGIAFSQDYMERALIAYPAIAAATVDLFDARLDPGGRRRCRAHDRDASSRPSSTR